MGPGRLFAVSYSRQTTLGPLAARPGEGDHCHVGPQVFAVSSSRQTAPWAHVAGQAGGGRPLPRGPGPAVCRERLTANRPGPTWQSLPGKAADMWALPRFAVSPTRQKVFSFVFLF